MHVFEPGAGVYRCIQAQAVAPPKSSIRPCLLLEITPNTCQYHSGTDILSITMPPLPAAGLRGVVRSKLA